NDNFLKQLSKKNIIAHGSVMFRKSTYKSAGGYRDFYKYSQDLDLWLRMCLISKVYIIPEVLYKLYILPGSVSDDIEKTVLQLYLRSLSKQGIKQKALGKEDLVDR